MAIHTPQKKTPKKKKPKPNSHEGYSLDETSLAAATVAAFPGLDAFKEVLEHPKAAVPRGVFRALHHGRSFEKSWAYFTTQPKLAQAQVFVCIMTTIDCVNEELGVCDKPTSSGVGDV